MSDSRRTALIAGASRGLGLGLAKEYVSRGWHVIGTVRGESRAALHDLAEREDALEIERLDIAVPEDVKALRARLQGRKLDLLFVNAGTANDPDETIGKVSTEEFNRVMVTNALSPMRVIETLDDLVTPDGTIAVMSSDLGSVADNEHGGWEVYRASKAALNTLMRSYGARHRNGRRALLIIAPGWVRTDMGGPYASLSVDESIPRVIDIVTAHSGKPGVRYLDYLGRTLRW